MKKLPWICIWLFCTLFFIFYKKSGKFKSSVIAAITAIYYFLAPYQAKASEVDAFTSPHPQHRIGDRDTKNSGIFGRQPKPRGKPSPGSGSGSNGSSNNDDDDSISKFPKNESVEKSEKSIEHPYYHQSVEEDDDQSDSEDQCLVNDRLKIAVSRDGSMTKVRAAKVRDKGLHIPEFISKNHLKGKFDVSKVKNLEYEDRLDYLRNKDNLPDEVVFETQDKIVEFLSAEDTILVPGFLGAKKIRGTIFINLRLNQFGFQDEDSYKYRTAGE